MVNKIPVKLDGHTPDQENEETDNVLGAAQAASDAEMDLLVMEAMKSLDKKFKKKVSGLQGKMKADVKKLRDENALTSENMRALGLQHGLKIVTLAVRGGHPKFVEKLAGPVANVEVSFAAYAQGVLEGAQEATPQGPDDDDQSFASDTSDDDY